MRVAGVAGDEHPREADAGELGRHVVEPVCEALAHLVDREPDDLLHLERVRVQHPPRDLDDLLRPHVADGGAVAAVELSELDVQADEITALARDEEDVAAAP